LRVRAFGSALFGLAVLATAVPATAPAHGTGKVSGGTSVSSSSPPSAPVTGAPAPAVAGGSTPAAGEPAKPVHTAPITARSASLVYNGPVYEKTAAGQVVPYTLPPPAGRTNGATGGSSAELIGNAKPELLVPGVTARYVDGLAAAPMSAPPAVQEIVWAGNQIIGLPYIYGGGHVSFDSPGYDCSGTVSFALHGAALLSTPMDSSEFMGWGGHGVGQWVTVFANPEHAYMTVAGLRLDTSPVDDPSDQQGPRWRPLRPENHGFVKRHPLGLYTPLPGSRLRSSLLVRSTSPPVGDVPAGGEVCFAAPAGRPPA
jgi:cell wall-associated NlpC family hydrolase